MGLARETAGFGTAAKVLKQLPFQGENLVVTRNLTPVPGAAGEGAYQYDKLTGIRHPGSVVHYLRYLEDDADALLPIRLALGSAEETDDALFFWPENPTVESATLCLARDGIINEYQGTTYQSLELEGKPSSPVFYNCLLAARKNETASTLNTDPDDWTIAEPAFVMFEDLAIYWNEYDGAGFSASDAKSVADFKVAFKGDFIVHQTGSSGLYISQPRRKKWECDINLTLPGSTTELAGLKAAQASGTYLKMMLSFSREINGTTRQVQIWIPKIQATLIDDHTEDERIVSPSIRLRAFKPGGTPAGFPSKDAPVIFQYSK